MARPGDARRAADRFSWPVRVFRLGDAPGDGLSDETTAVERIGMMWPLVLEAWALAGRPLPGYSRGETPVTREPGPSAPEAAVNDDFRDLLAALLTAGARFLVVGAHALAVHGVPRATGDLIGRAALVRNKRATGRAKDVADLEALAADPQP